MKKFWNWKNRTVTNKETQEQIQERTLFLNGTIAEESWFDDDVTPQLFKDELMSGSGNITVWINSPGGDCVAAAQIYNMLMDYHGDVTVKIDGIAASAASVIAMAGTKVLMSPTALMMIHNPLTVAIGDSEEMQKAIDMPTATRPRKTSQATTSYSFRTTRPSRSRPERQLQKTVPVFPTTQLPATVYPHPIRLVLQLRSERSPSPAA